MSQLLYYKPVVFKGLKVNDLVTRFGSVNISNFSGLQMIGSLVQNSKSVSVLFTQPW